MATHEMSSVSKEFWIHSMYMTRGERRYFVHALQKLPGGVRELTESFPTFDEDDVMRRLSLRGTFLARPFTLEEGHDSTNVCCTFALYCDFCRRRGLDPSSLYRAAYQPREGKRYRDPDVDWIVREAEWQGLISPEHWEHEALRLLLRRLCSQNFSSLVVALLETPPLLAVGRERLERWRQEW